MSNEYNQFLRNQKQQKEDLDKKLKAEKDEMIKLQRSALDHFDHETKQKRAQLVANNASDLTALEVSQSMQREALKEQLLSIKYEKSSKKRKITEEEEDLEEASMPTTSKVENSYNLSQSQIQLAIQQYVQSLSSNQQKSNNVNKTIQSSTPRAPMGDLTSSMNRLGTPYNCKVQSASNQMDGSVLLDLQCYSDSSKHSNSVQHNEESLSNISDLKFLENYDAGLIEAIRDLESDEEEETVIDRINEEIE